MFSSLARQLHYCSFFQVLERRYGGRLRAHTAATRIQRAFRQSCLLKQWKHLVLPIQNSAACSRSDGSQGCNDVLKRDTSLADTPDAQARLYRLSATSIRYVYTLILMFPKL